RHPVVDRFTLERRIKLAPLFNRCWLALLHIGSFFTLFPLRQFEASPVSTRGKKFAWALFGLIWLNFLKFIGLLSNFRFQISNRISTEAAPSPTRQCFGLRWPSGSDDTAYACNHRPQATGEFHVKPKSLPGQNSVHD
ncbi:MAG TPA: hypothetical protein VG347_20020, partial [Verrucomicrobiae bacterium]|nr:hypothetical protein [Verrucomicrobiae bacterium]